MKRFLFAVVALVGFASPSFADYEEGSCDVTPISHYVDLDEAIDSLKYRARTRAAGAYAFTADNVVTLRSSGKSTSVRKCIVGFKLADNKVQISVRKRGRMKHALRLADARRCVRQAYEKLNLASSPISQVACVQ